MNIQNTRERLLASTMIGGAALLALAATPAMAQDQDQEATRVDEIVITGTRIAQANLVTTSPVTQVTGEDITNAGVSRVEDLVNQLPQVFAGQTSTVVNGSSGTATVDLRGLGPNRTVVLIDGRRMPYGSPAIAAADLNQIPSALVERVEVYTGGASAVYGADAVAGVVNFIMRKNFEGVRVDASYGFYQHENDYDGVGNVRAEIARRGITNPAEFQLPDDNVTDGETMQFSLIVGTDVGGGRGNITSYFTYRENNPVFQGDRDYSACAIGAPNAASGADTFSCGGSATSAGGYFTDFLTYGYTLDQGSGGFVNYNPDIHAYNYGPINYYMRPEERYSFGVFANYELNRAAEVYTQLMFTDSSTLAQIAPSGSFFNNATINCNNPLLLEAFANSDPLVANPADIGCDAAAIAAGDDTTFYVGRRNVEGGPRVQDYNLNSYRLVGGLRGDISDAWSYDLTAQYARVQYTDQYIGDFSIQRLGRALDVVDVGGTPTCQSVIDGTDPNCVPYNPFSPGGIDQAQLDYLTLPLIATGYVTNQVLTAAMTGDLGVYGVQSPWASSGMQVAFGTEYRRDYLTLNPDSGYGSGDGAGQGGAFIGIAGATTARDYFGEFILPIAEGLPFAESITLDAAYRHSKYNLADDTDTYKVGLDWAPTSDVRFRASYARAVRAPNVFNLFSAQNVVLFGRGSPDPCGAGGYATQAQCVATGVPAAAYGSVGLNSPANQYNQQTGGNTALNAEEADTYTYGVVFTPTFLPGFNLSIDYFDIEVAGAIGAFGASNTIDACYGGAPFNAPDPAACARLNRAPGGQLWTNNGFVENLSINTGGIITQGVDFVANYNMNLDDFGLAGMGGLAFNLTGTWLDTLEIQPADGAPTLECAGFYEGSCGFGSPEWRHRFTTSWSTPWDVNLLLTWRYHGEVEHFGLTGAGLDRIDRYFDAYNWFDVGATWQVFDNTRFRVGINNVFDEDPPLSYSGNGNGNTYPGVYDAMGRYIFFGVTADF
ncbi:MAG: iron complex outermembrane receptor protein [Brevundimonas sp.]|uniref:TonB-dependent receptor domain-containing protein n=1 Tax=Brevundimonas sp. TaxID=1871086 RepID=UPI0039E32FAD